MANTLLVFGHGYAATALSRRLVPAGWRVIGTTRDQDRLGAMAELGVEGRLWPGAEIDDALKDASHLLLSIAPGDGGDPVLDAFGKKIVERATEFDWVGYLSTTAVYGDHQGGWVDETTPPAPTTRRGTWRVAAEAAWTELAEASGLPLHVFRLAGIYGPDRGPLAKVRAGTARRIIKEGQVFSRIHVDDIAETLLASMARPNPVRVYNVCDDEAAPPEDVIGYAAEALGLPVPQSEDFSKAKLSPMALSFYRESKRVYNARIKEELGVKLRYPTYREGLTVLATGKQITTPKR